MILLLLTLYAQALEDYQHARYREAEQKLRQIKPPTFDSRFLLGATLVHLERRGEAIEELKAAVAMRPAHQDARKLLASQYLAVGRAGACDRPDEGAADR